MKTKLKLLSLYEKDSSNYDVQLASRCPCCGVTLSPKVIYGTIVDYPEDEDKNKVFLLNFCSECEECFISKHTIDEEDDGYIFDSSAPVNYAQQVFSSEITELSSDFVKIYNDALKAETIGLTSICGMGYRKSLEFLVKDYAIHKHPEKKEIIISKPLMGCINEYISDDRLKSLAKASTWIGNDETHYVKKHKDYDTKNLRTFINAFVTFIDADLAYENASKLINN